MEDLILILFFGIIVILWVMILLYTFTGYEFQKDLSTNFEVKLRKLFNIKPSEEALKEFMGEE